MRTVLIYKHERREREKSNAHPYGGNYLEKVPDGEGLFHQWGIDYEEFDTGAGNFTTAIVERPNGEIVTPPANMIQFLTQ